MLHLCGWMRDIPEPGSAFISKGQNKPGKQVACNCSLGTFLGPAADARKIHDYLTPTRWSANSCWCPCLRWTLCGSVRNAVGAPWPGDLRLACLEDGSPHQPLFTRKTQTALGWFVDHSTKFASGWKTETARGLCLSDLKHYLPLWKQRTDTMII